jgi:hypothetical protein
LRQIDERIDSFPLWMRPPFYGMFLVYGMIFARVILVLPVALIVLLAAGPEGILKVIWILIVAGLAGFAGGVAFTLVHPLLRRLGRVGAILTGWVCVFSYLSVIVPAVSQDPASRHYFDMRNPIDWGITVALSVIFGSVLGIGFIEEPNRARRFRPPWVQRKQRVTSRVHPPSP